MDGAPPPTQAPTGAFAAWLAVAGLALVPLWLTGELGWYSFEEPRSHLVWDEAMGREPTPLDEPGGPRMLMARFAAGGLVLAVLALVAASDARRRAARSRP